MIKKIAEIKGYDVYQDKITHHYGIVKCSELPPSHCGYKNLTAMLLLKNLDAMDLKYV